LSSRRRLSFSAGRQVPQRPRLRHGLRLTPTVTQDWTNNLDGLQTGVNKLRPGGGTALFDAVYTACRDKLLDISRGQEPVRRAMVLVSDGNDNQSRAYIDDAIKMCQRSETIIYAISTNWTPSRGKGDDVSGEDG
jgi:Ca-activated chloride channel family protein